MIINASNFTEMTNPQVIDVCHRSVAIAPLIILFFAFTIFFLIFGFSVVRTFDGQKKMLKVLIWTILCSAIIFVILILMPNFTQEIVDIWIRLKG